MLNPVIASLGLIQGGQMRAIATTAARRSSALPEIPALGEMGFPDYDITLFAGLIAPAGTPLAVLDQINNALNVAKASQDLKAQLEKGGQELPPRESVEQFNAFLRNEAARYAKIVRERGLKAEE